LFRYLKDKKMQVEVLNTKGKKTGRSVELPEEIFGAEPNNHVIYLAVKQYLAAQRQGTHKVKTRAEVQGASRKLHRQKGTGGSRKGNIRNPLYKGGGSIFGPKPHLYDFKLNRKVKDLAKISALSYKAKDNAIVIVEDITMDIPKTKTFIDILGKLKVADKKVMFIQPEYNDNVELSLRNVPSVLGVLLSDINTYDIVNSEVLVLTESAAKIFSEEEKAEA
jgi:large subunit ribosomal protein L4